MIEFVGPGGVVGRRLRAVVTVTLIASSLTISKLALYSLLLPPPGHENV